jgi:DNA adenine methylase
MSRNNSDRSPIRWVGGKKWLAPRVAEMYTPHSGRRFVELFAGGLGLSFHLQPKRVLANDINSQLMNFYYWMKREPRQHLIEFDSSEAGYYASRSRYNEILSIGGAFLQGKELAELFYYLNRTCFNGLYRVNQKGKFNTPYGKLKSPILLRDLSEFSEIAREWEFLNLSFEEAWKQVSGEDFVIADPPYDDTFVGYADGGFNFESQVKLANLLSAHPGPVVTTNNATERIVKLYTDLGFTIEKVERKHKVNPAVETGERPMEVICYRNM